MSGRSVKSVFCTTTIIIIIMNIYFYNSALVQKNYKYKMSIIEDQNILTYKRAQPFKHSNKSHTQGIVYTINIKVQVYSCTKYGKISSLAD